MTVAVGDVVMLRSGGFKMTVCKVNDEQSVLCCWFVDNQLQREIFPATALVVVESVTVEKKETKVCNPWNLLREGKRIRHPSWKEGVFAVILNGQAKLFSGPDDPNPFLLNHGDFWESGVWEIV